MESVKILVVDDSAMVRKITMKSLEKAGYTVLEAADGEEALVMVRDERPKLVILDLVMPKLNGMEVCRILRDDPKNNLLPIVMLTALGSQPVKLQGLEKGADAYLTKPFDEPELLALVRNLTGKTKERERLDQLREDRMHMEVHDLKAPLGNIVNLCDLLIHETLTPEEQKEFLGMVSESAKIGLRLVMTRLNLAALEESRLELHREVLNPHEVILSAVNQMVWMGKNRNLEVITQLDVNAGEMFADRDLIIRVLVNLLDNAVKHSQSVGQVRVSMIQEGPFLRMGVKDNGAGIPPEFQAGVFEKFSKMSEKGSLSTGLGLTFCKMVAEAHGGKINLTSQVGQGSEFSIWIPVHAPAEMMEGDSLLANGMA
ncbi:MAG: hybrid sensor histidine kinase/response regulator [Deltaproteobacteria bacterium]|nr:hybrid sensor histidine kinase/response regulator [Deltaproteobacteria bacterium]